MHHGQNASGGEYSTAGGKYTTRRSSAACAGVTFATSSDPTSPNKENEKPRIIAGPASPKRHHNETGSLVENKVAEGRLRWQPEFHHGARHGAGARAAPGRVSRRIPPRTAPALVARL